MGILARSRISRQTRQTKPDQDPIIKGRNPGT